MKKIICVILIKSIFISGCSMFSPSTDTVSASCSEQDAKLQINGQFFPASGQVEVKKIKLFR